MLHIIIIIIIIIIVKRKTAISELSNSFRRCRRVIVEHVIGVCNGKTISRTIAVDTILPYTSSGVDETRLYIRPIFIRKRQWGFSWDIFFIKFPRSSNRPTFLDIANSFRRAHASIHVLYNIFI